MTEDIVATAINDSIRIKTLIEDVNKKIKDCNEKCKVKCKEKNITGEGISRRSKDLPQLIYSVGLVPSIIYYMSKSEEAVYKTLLEYIINGKNSAELEICTCKENECKLGKLVGELGSGEGAGYTVLLALTVKHLKETGHLENTDDFKSLAQDLKKLREEGRESIATDLLIEYLTQVKRLSEAFFRGEQP